MGVSCVPNAQLWEKRWNLLEKWQTFTRVGIVVLIVSSIWIAFIWPRTDPDPEEITFLSTLAALV